MVAVEEGKVKDGAPVVADVKEGKEEVVAPVLVPERLKLNPPVEPVLVAVPVALGKEKEGVVVAVVEGFPPKLKLVVPKPVVEVEGVPNDGKVEAVPPRVEDGALRLNDWDKLKPVVVFLSADPGAGLKRLVDNPPVVAAG